MLGILIPTYNRLDTLKATVEKVREFTQGDYRVFVSDDGSTDGTSDWLSTQNDVTTIDRHSHGGIAWNVNQGLYQIMQAYLSITDIIILEDDVQPCCPDWAALWVKAARRWGCVQYVWDGVETWGGLGIPDSPYVAGLVGAQVIATTREAIEKAGYFNPAYYEVGWGWAHVEWGYRFNTLYNWGISRSNMMALRHGVLLTGVPSHEQPGDAPENHRIHCKLLLQGWDNSPTLPWRDEAERQRFLDGSK